MAPRSHGRAEDRHLISAVRVVRSPPERVPVMALQHGIGDRFAQFRHGLLHRFRIRIRILCPGLHTGSVSQTASSAFDIWAEESDSM